MKWTSTITVPADTRALRLISSFVLGNAELARIPKSFFNNLDLVTEEASTNVIQHAYKSDPSQSLDVTCRFDGKQFSVIVCDRGEPFELESVPIPDIHADKSKREPGGLGLFFIRTLMDELRQEHDADGTNRLIMIKKKPYKSD
ncbi:ATP-binding protein [candidate division KSB1 bacterium]|nr:ATP-binding protein [candidate division KSB1 bacterium]